MTLNLNTGEANEEFAAVAELKTKVREIAKRYATKHGWCDVVNQALEEAGIEGVTALPVNITFTLAGSDPQNLVKRIELDALMGKTEAEQNAWVGSKIAPKVNVGGVEVTIPITVTDLSEKVSDAEEMVTVKDVSYHKALFRHAFMGEDPSALHLVRVRDIGKQRADDPERYIRYMNDGVYSLCGNLSRRYQHDAPADRDIEVCNQCRQQSLQYVTQHENAKYGDVLKDEA